MTLSKDDINTLLSKNDHIDLLCNYCGKNDISDQINLADIQQNIYQSHHTIH